MATKRYHVTTPEALEALEQMANSGQDTFMLTVSVWMATQRRKGKTRWDNAIFAEFCGTRKKIAEVTRLAADGSVELIGTLRYNIALHWCKEHLPEAHDA